METMDIEDDASDAATYDEDEEDDEDEDEGDELATPPDNDFELDEEGYEEDNATPGIKRKAADLLAVADTLGARDIESPEAAPDRRMPTAATSRGRGRQSSRGRGRGRSSNQGTSVEASANEIERNNLIAMNQARLAALLQQAQTQGLPLALQQGLVSQSHAMQVPPLIVQQPVTGAQGSAQQPAAGAQHSHAPSTSQHAALTNLYERISSSSSLPHPGGPQGS